MESGRGRSRPGGSQARLEGPPRFWTDERPGARRAFDTPGSSRRSATRAPWRTGLTGDGAASRRRPGQSGLAMIIPLEPRLEGLAERRFFSFARQMLDRQARDPARIGNLVEDETTRVSGLDDLKGQSDQYEACVRVLGDLAQLRWTLVESGYGLELHSPRPQDKRVSGPVQARRRKDAIRNELRPRVLQQLADPNVRKFIHRMERPPASARRNGVSATIWRRCSPSTANAPCGMAPVRSWRSSGSASGTISENCGEVAGWRRTTAAPAGRISPALTSASGFAGRMDERRSSAASGSTRSAAKRVTIGIAGRTPIVWISIANTWSNQTAKSLATCPWSRCSSTPSTS